ncbi:hypothetical protein Patl1_09376 [Pistacia atlantica]|uniref:Uncharacterized protein n=1 Tax=Pistacia atlantica TaxID=434234 RepID=A0ACC1AJD3_9ROSI|nr:hypothetical protein Patl1_09376 [Pistacia atlantica]
MASHSRQISNSLKDEPAVNQIQNQSGVDERYVLNELSELLQISRNNSVSNLYKESDSVKQIERRVVDGFLLPDEMLRGVFLQKLKGKTAIEDALTNVNVDLSLDVVAKVVNRGNLGGEAMVTFFNWAIKQPNIPKDVQRCLCQRLHVGAANSFFNSMRGKVLFNGKTYDIIIGGWSKLGEVSEIERVLKEMVVEGFSPDTSTFCYLIEGLGRAGRIDDAIAVFHAMKEKGCGPDTNAYNALISNYISIGDFDECMKYYKGMLSNKCDPNLDTYTKLIHGLLKARKVADALEVFEEMLDRGLVPSMGTITSFIEPLCSFGPPHAAMMIYKKARKAGCKLSLSAYKLLLMRLSRFGKCGMLLDLWYEMQECGYSSDLEVYEYVITGLCNVGQLENAVLVMEESLRKGFCPSRLVYSKLSNKLLASNKLERAYKLFLKIKAARRNENVRSYSCVILVVYLQISLFCFPYGLLSYFFILLHLQERSDAQILVGTFYYSIVDESLREKEQTVNIVVSILNGLQFASGKEKPNTADAQFHVGIG